VKRIVASAYVISYDVDIEYADGEYDGDTVDNVYNAERYVNDCIEDGEYNDNPVVYYRIVKHESDGGIAVSEEVIKEEELDY
jgi:hypothetical protein